MRGNEKVEWIKAVQNTTAACVSYYTKHSKKLDYSRESLQVAENILEACSEFIFQDDEIVQSTSQLLGSYIFKVVYRTCGGEYFWYDQGDTPVLVVGRLNFEVSFAPIEKVKGRIMNGKEDDIVFYCGGIFQHIEKGRQEQGYKVFVV